MKRVLMMLCVLCCAFTAFAQQEAQFNFTTTEHNFGDVPRGPDVTFNFEYTNTGIAPLVITMAKGSCDCTKAEYSSTAVAPGEKGTIKAIFETKDKEGTFNKTIYIFSNATDRKEPFEITIKGNVLIDTAAGEKPVQKKSSTKKN